jgi:uroporphyrinogen-III synthase
MAEGSRPKLKIRSILVSQPKPEPGERTPLVELGARYGIKIDFRPFIEVKGISAKDFRKSKIALGDYKAIILNSRNAVDHYFRLCEEMRVEVDPETRYFCISDTVGHYLQRYTQLRKRKIAYGKGKLEDLIPQMMKHKDIAYLMPCSDALSEDFLQKAEHLGLKITKAVMFQTVSSDLSDLADIKYDVLCFFSPVGIKSLFENFPDFVQNETRIAALGVQTHDAVLQSGLRLDIAAPTSEFPSLVMALEACLKKTSK